MQSDTKKIHSCVTANFLLTIVCPNISNLFTGTDHTNKVAEVLALPLLYAAFDPTIDYIMTDEVKQRIRDGYQNLRGEDFNEEYNPVEKVPLLVHRCENMLLIDDTTGAGAANGSDGRIR